LRPFLHSQLNSAALFALGCVLRIKAVRWYKLAAAQGIAHAQYNLALMYDQGQGVAQNYKEAVYWYKIAAAQGLAKAQQNLGAMNASGDGTAQNYIQAHVWFNLAAAQGNKEAVEKRNQIAKLMSPQKIAQAQKLATECLARNYKNCD
jgi:TPR repeat protein